MNSTFVKDNFALGVSAAVTKERALGGEPRELTLGLFILAALANLVWAGYLARCEAAKDRLTAAHHR